MLGYIVPALLVAATLVGCQLAFQRVWLTLVLTAVVALILPYGELHGKPLIRRLAELPGAQKRRKRRGWRRHRYYTP